jgi:hypothetical protein
MRVVGVDVTGIIDQMRITRISVHDWLFLPPVERLG